MHATDRRFDWDDVRVFLAVHRAGSHTSAARALRTNQSTVGRRLVAFEKRLGTKLFLRTTDGWALSSAGEQLLPHAERMEDESLAISRELAGAEGRLVGTIRVTGADAFSARVLAPMLAAFQRRAPGIDVELVGDNRLLSLSKREADMAIRVNRPREPAVVARRLADLGVGLYASRRYIAERGRPEPDYSEHLAIGFDDSERGIPEARWLARDAKKARTAFRANGSLAQLAATVEGAGFALLPAYLAVREPELVEILPPRKVLMQSVWLVLHADLQHSAKIRALADFLTAELGALSSFLRDGKPKRR
jgi:DNA-binding transcriptional LysR family regulator